MFQNSIAGPVSEKSGVDDCINTFKLKTFKCGVDMCIWCAYACTNVMCIEMAKVH